MIDGATISSLLAQELNDPGRLAALRRIQLLDTTPDPVFDRIPRLARALTGCTTALLSFIDSDRHYWKSAVGLPEPWGSSQEIPLSHSYSKFVVTTGKPLVVNDARTHPLTQKSPAVAEMAALSYVGQPLITRDGHVIGSMCVIDRRARDWTAGELDALKDMAALAMTEIELREEVAQRRRAEGLLQESKERFRQLAGHQRHVFWLRSLGSEGMLYVSPAYETVFGRSREELYADASAFLNAVHPEDRERVAALSREAERLGFADEYRVVHPGGEVLWVRATAFLVDDATGTPYRLAGIVEDITEQRRAGEALRLSEARLEDAQRIAHLGHWDWDIRTNDLSWSREIYRIFGLEPGAFGSSYPAFLERVHPDDREKVVAAVADAVERGLPYSIGHRVVRPDGSVRHVHENGEVTRTASGEPIRMLGTVQDITERHMAEERLAERESRLRSILDSEPACVSVVSPDGVLQEINAAGLALHEASSPEEVIGKSIEMFAPPEYREAVVALRERVLQGESVRLELELVGLKGTRRWIERHAAPLRDARGEICAVLALTSDITDRKRLEEKLHQSQKMEAVGRLASGVAHDFNNVLTAIVGHTTLLLDDLHEAAALRTDVEEILRSAERGAALIQQLLLFSRSEAPTTTDVDLNAVVIDLERMLRRLIAEDVVLSTSLEPMPELVRADRSRLEQLLLNLVVNARDAMPAGGQLSIETRRVELSAVHVQRRLVPHEGPYVRLKVSDTGCGMDPETLSKIFEPFFTTKARGSGTGLGLSTVYGVVTQSGGGIQVESEVGQGTTFEIYLPLSRGSQVSFPPNH